MTTIHTYMYVASFWFLDPFSFYTTWFKNHHNEKRDMLCDDMIGKKKKQGKYFKHFGKTLNFKR